MTERVSHPDDVQHQTPLPKVTGGSLSDLKPAEDSVLARAIRRVAQDIALDERYSAFSSTTPS
jgi:FXSXX-COOH protein